MTDGKRCPQDPGAWFAEACSAAGIKATPQRQAIYAALCRTEEHPDAETIHAAVKQQLPSLGLDTVYRNLRLLEEHGIIQRVGALGYRARYDANQRHHHHFVCRACGQIRDFYDPQLDNYTPPRTVRALGTPDALQIELRGICRTCQRLDGRR